MHLLFIQPEANGVGGIQRVTADVALALMDRGWKVGLCSFYGRVDIGWSYGRSLQEECTNSVISRLIKVWRRVFFIAQIVRNEKPDCLLVSTHNTSVLVLILKCLHIVHQPVLLYVHQSTKAPTGLFTAIFRYLIPYANGIICVSEGISKECRILAPKVTNVVAYNAVSKKPPRLSLPNEMRIITASRLEEIKGVDALVELCARYFSMHPGTLYIYGEGSLTDPLQERINLLHMEDRIVLKGYTEDVFSVLNNATLYVSCARSEAFGLSLLEALAAGVPVVATDADTGPREVLGISTLDGSYPKYTESGVMFALTPPLDDESLRKWVDNNLDNFSKSVEYAMTISSIGIQDRAQLFSLETQVENISKLCLSVCKEK